MQNSPNSAIVSSTSELRVVDVVEGTSVDGPGLRTSIYLAGCEHRCPGCHNPQTWPMEAGHTMSVDEIVEIVERNGFNVTFSGGDPMYQPEGLAEVCRRLKELGYNVWCYTGFTLEELQGNPLRSKALDYIDVLVDGPYVEALRDETLRFRGSSNQRIIELRTGRLLYSESDAPSF